MSPHIDDMLDAWLAGRLDAEQDEQFATHVGNCERCREQVRITQSAFGELTRELPPATPSEGLKAQIMSDLAPAARFARFRERVSELIDVSVERAGELLGQIDEIDPWVPGPSEGVELFHIDGGPRVEDAIVGFIKIGSGGEFPHHKHLGTERVFVLQGSFQDSSGTVHGLGDLVVEPPGSEHDFHVCDGPELIYLVVVEEGIEMFGMTIGPGDPQL